jgi:hypothetical protein
VVEPQPRLFLAGQGLAIDEDDVARFDQRAGHLDPDAVQRDAAGRDHFLDVAAGGNSDAGNGLGDALLAVGARAGKLRRSDTRRDRAGRTGTLASRRTVAERRALTAAEPVVARPVEAGAVAVARRTGSEIARTLVEPALALRAVLLRAILSWAITIGPVARGTRAERTVTVARRTRREIARALVTRAIPKRPLALRAILPRPVTIGPVAGGTRAEGTVAVARRTRREITRALVTRTIFARTVISRSVIARAAGAQTLATRLASEGLGAKRLAPERLALKRLAPERLARPIAARGALAPGAGGRTCFGSGTRLAAPPFVIIGLVGHAP